ncbi:MAG: hypothetical protein JOZ81_32230 [Chloroflexi bacterium]|nr:hypothetical protein [Chloroflexota bacterium]
MLAYVFWHWPAANQDVPAYEAAEREFLTALRQAAPSGFVDCTTFRVGGEAPWLGGAPAYADWYLVQDSAALDPLNVAAVSGVCEEPHFRLTRAMGAGAGSLLQLRGGEPHLTSARCVTWLGKPREMPYSDLYAGLSSLPGSLWRRQMVLGPTPEFALLGSAATQVDAALSPRALTLMPLA